MNPYEEFQIEYAENGRDRDLDYNPENQYPEWLETKYGSAYADYLNHLEHTTGNWLHTDNQYVEWLEDQYKERSI